MKCFNFSKVLKKQKTRTSKFWWSQLWNLQVLKYVFGPTFSQRAMYFHVTDMDWLKATEGNIYMSVYLNSHSCESLLPATQRWIFFPKDRLESKHLSQTLQMIRSIWECNTRQFQHWWHSSTHKNTKLSFSVAAGPSEDCLFIILLNVWLVTKVCLSLFSRKHICFISSILF